MKDPELLGDADNCCKRVGRLTGVPGAQGGQQPPRDLCGCHPSPDLLEDFGDCCDSFTGVCWLPVKGLCSPEGSCSAAGLGTGERRLLEALWRGRFSRDAGREKLSPRGCSVYQTASSRKTTPFWFLTTRIKYHPPCILAKVMGKEIQSKCAGKDEILIGFNFTVRGNQHILRHLLD